MSTRENIRLIARAPLVCLSVAALDRVYCTSFCKGKMVFASV